MAFENAGLEGSVVVKEIRDGKGDYGYNAHTEKFENLLAGAHAMDQHFLNTDSASNLPLVMALIFTMLAGIILGMGMPTTPAYIMQVALLVPIIRFCGQLPGLEPGARSDGGQGHAHHSEDDEDGDHR